MQFPHISGLDITLVEPLYALLDERHVTRAARRCAMSQSAMSRSLQRLRSSLEDELLVHAAGSYERTPRGDQLHADLQDLLPRLDASLRGRRFDPENSRDTFRIATTDYAASVLIPDVLERIAKAAPHARIDIAPWNDCVFEDIGAGRTHLAIIGANARKSSESDHLFTDEFVCVVAANHPLKASRVTLKRYLEYGHAAISIANGGQPWIDNMLAKKGCRRRVAYRTPYQISGILVASQTTLICTTARRLATKLAPMAKVRLLEAPREMPKISYHMTWHRRLHEDAAHSWLRAQIRAVARNL